jgi:hypothetical protein
MRLPGFAAEASLYRTHGYQTTKTHWGGIGSNLVRAQVVWGPGGPPGSISVCEVFPWLCGGGPWSLCAHCGSNPVCNCICKGGYWNGYQCT